MPAGLRPWGPLTHMQGLGGVSGKVGTWDRRREGSLGCVLSGGCRMGSGSWLLTTPSPALILRGLHDGARAPGVPAAAAGPALPLLQQPAACRGRLRLQGPGPAHGEQRHRSVYGSQDPAVRSPAGAGKAGVGELPQPDPVRLPSPGLQVCLCPFTCPAGCPGTQLSLFLPCPGTFLCEGPCVSLSLLSLRLSFRPLVPPPDFLGLHL